MINFRTVLSNPKNATRCRLRRRRVFIRVINEFILKVCDRTDCADQRASIWPLVILAITLWFSHIDGVKLGAWISETSPIFHLLSTWSCVSTVTKSRCYGETPRGRKAAKQARPSADEIIPTDCCCHEPEAPWNRSCGLCELYILKYAFLKICIDSNWMVKFVIWDCRDDRVIKLQDLPRRKLWNQNK